VWSLGCMFLEICAFVVLGHTGVRDLDRTRLTKRGNVMDDRFFIRVGEGVHEVKPEVRIWIEALQSSESVRTPRSSDFVREFLALVGHMLQPNVFRRMTAQEVCQRLEGITMRYQPHPDSLQEVPSQHILLRQGDSEYAPHLTQCIRTMMYHHNDQWISGGLKIVEDNLHDVYVLSLAGSTQLRFNIGSRASVKVVPRFANHTESPEEFLDCHLHFLNAGYDAVREGNPTTKLYFRDLGECSLAYSGFIGHDIISSSRIQQCIINRQVLFIRRLSRHDSDLVTEVPSTVELWYENYRLHPALPSRSNSSRSVRHNTFSEPAHRRIVVYFQRSILIIRFAKNVRLKHPEQADLPNVATLVPTAPSRDPTFTVSLLKPRKGEAVVAIPISSTHLEHEEDSHQFECKSVEICFEDERQRRIFCNSYRRMKDEWRNENKQLEDVRRNMGPMIGYAAN
jgi:hypothetical protein